MLALIHEVPQSIATLRLFAAVRDITVTSLQIRHWCRESGSRSRPWDILRHIRDLPWENQKLLGYLLRSCWPGDAAEILITPKPLQGRLRLIRMLRKAPSHLGDLNNAHTRICLQKGGPLQPLFVCQSWSPKSIGLPVLTTLVHLTGASTRFEQTLSMPRVSFSAYHCLPNRLPTSLDHFGSILPVIPVTPCQVFVNLPLPV